MLNIDTPHDVTNRTMNIYIYVKKNIVLHSEMPNVDECFRDWCIVYTYIYSVYVVIITYIVLYETILYNMN